MFLNNIRNIFKSYETALQIATKNNLTEIVQLLIEKEGIDINVIDAYLFNLVFNFIISDFKTMFENYSKYLEHHL